MNELVKASIDSRHQSFFAAYDIKDENILKKIEELFKRIEEFGAGCIDSADFEMKFASSPLNQEYIDLFTLVAQTSEAKTIEHTENHVKSDAEYLADEVASDVRYVADDLTMPARRKARQEVYDKARDIPVLGEAMTAKQHFDFFSRFKKHKD